MKVNSDLKNLLSAIIEQLRFRHQEIWKALVIICAAAFLVFLMPRQFKFGYDYEIGRPWLHNNLIAPFDFPIEKNKVLLEEELSKIKELHNPYFKIHDSIGNSAIKSTSEALNSDSIFTDLKSLRQIKPLIIKLLNNQYQIGIIDRATTELFEPTKNVVLVKEDKSAYEIKISDFLTLQEAYDNLEAGLKDAIKDNVTRTELLNFLEKQLNYNVIYDEQLTLKLLDEKLSNVTPYLGSVQKDELIIAKGSLVTQEKANMLVSLSTEFEELSVSKTQQKNVSFGYVIAVVLLFGIYLFFLYALKPQIYQHNRKIFLLIFNLVLLVWTYSFLSKFSLSSLYLIPFCVLPIVTRALFDSLVAIISTLIAALMLQFFAADSMEFLLVNLTAGVGAIFSLLNIRIRSQFFLSSFIAFILGAAMLIGYRLVVKTELQEMDLYHLGNLGFGIGLSLLAMPLLYGYERVFGFVSDVTLMELSDTNNKLLRELSLKAPGTFQHSLQVANLAEACCESIGGNALLVRVGALYHDIGKMENPQYFIENQGYGVNPHDSIPFEDSAQIIINHVINGVKLGKKNRLPGVIMDFIRTHHGDQRVEYFYQSFLKNFPNDQIDETKFRYPGPKPFSKETAVLMMCDSVEAAARSLKDVSEQSLSNLVEGIIDKQLANNQFERADITLQQIAKIKTILRKMLASIYHLRVAYPKGA